MGAEGEAEQLVAEADPEDRDRVEQPAEDGDGPVDGFGVAGTVGEEHAVGLAGQRVGGRGGRRDDLDVTAGGDEMAQQGGLDAVVVGDDPERRVTVADRVRGVDGDLGDEVDALGAGCVTGRVADLGLVGAERAGHRAGLPEVAGEAAGVDAGEPGDAPRREVRAERAGRPPVRRPVR